MLIADIRQREHREARILFVTARVSLSMQTMELLRGLGFTMYADLSGAVSLQEHPRLIFQIESLPRVFSSDMEPFDAVYADEIAQSIGSTFALRVCVCVCACVC